MSRPAEAEAFGRRLLVQHGLSEADAATVAQCLVRADLRGVDTHGLQFLPHYLARVRAGLINPKPALDAQTRDARRRPARWRQRLRLRGRHAGDRGGHGDRARVRYRHRRCEAQHAFRHGRLLRAAGAGGGLHLVRVLQRLARHAAVGRARGADGTNPFAAGAPAGKETPFLLDMSPAVAARGKIRRAARRGEKFPVGYALDKGGRSTTDPNVALDGGVVLPIGGPKGSGISMLMDIMGGVISGAASGGDVGSQFLDFDRTQDVGHFFLAMKPDLFVPAEQYRAAWTSWWPACTRTPRQRA